MSKWLNIIGIGELLWDFLPEGKRLGGAPANFVYHAQKLGAQALVMSAIGNDENGKEILEVLKNKNISSELIQVNDNPTGMVEVTINEEGVPEYIIHENVAWDFIIFNEVLHQIIKQANIICFGSLAQRNKTSRKTIVELLKCCSPETLIVYDINLRQHFFSKEIIESSLQLCNVLKLNEEELPVVAELLGIFMEREELQLHELIKRYNLKLVAFTKGSKGSLLMTPSKKSYMQTPVVKIMDTVGAGDSFTAAMIVGFANGETLDKVHQKAVDISAFVCTKHGAMPEYN